MANFSDIVGYADVIAQLKSVIARKRFSHAYILCGEDGSGKKLLAEAFAKTLLCEKGGEDACGQCISCKQAESQNHPDIRRVVREKASLSVKEIREQIVSDAQIKPYSSEYKVYIIEDAQTMTEEAQNALLKTIEEPPEYAVFFLLTTQKESLLPTILSRSVSLLLPPVASREIAEFLMKKRGVPDYLAESAAAFSGGIIGRAVRFSESEDFARMRSEILHIVKNINHMSMAELMESVKLLTTQKDNIPEYLNMLTVWYRDVLLFKATQDGSMLYFREQEEETRRQARECSYEKLQRILDAIEQLKTRMRSNVNTETAMELLLLDMKED